MIPCSGYFRVERGYEIEKSIFNLIIGKSEGIDIEFRIEILDGQIATLVNHGIGRVASAVHGNIL